MIKTEIDKTRQLTIHIGEGPVSLDELAAEIRSLYEDELMPYHLWDLSAADMSGIGSREVHRLADIAKEAAKGRTGRRTAIVSRRDVGFGLGRVYQAYADMVGLHAEVSVFRTRKQAEDWLAER